MADVSIRTREKDGFLSFVDPQTKRGLWIDPKDAQQSVDDGLIPESAADYDTRKRNELLENPVVGAAAGGLSGISGGLAPAALIKMGVVDADDWKRAREGSPIAHGLFNVGGTVAGALVGGPVALTGKLASKAGVAAAKVAGKGLLGKAAGGAAALAVEGGAFGAGQAVENVAVSGKDLLSVESAKHIAQGAGVGAGLAIGTGVLAQAVVKGVGAGGKTALGILDAGRDKRLGTIVNKRTLAQARVDAIDAQSAALKDSMAGTQAKIDAGRAAFGKTKSEIAAIDEQIVLLEQQATRFDAGLNPQAAKAASDAKRQLAVLRKSKYDLEVQNGLRATEGRSHIAELKKAQLEETRLGQQVTAQRATIKELSDSLAAEHGGSIGRAAGVIAQVKMRSGGLGIGMAGFATGGPLLGLLAYRVGPTALTKLGKYLGKVSAGEAPRLQKAIAGVKSALRTETLSGLRGGTVKALTTDLYTDLKQSLESFDEKAFTEGAKLASYAHDPAIVADIAKRQIAARQHLMAVMPKAPMEDERLGSKPYEPSSADLRRFSRHVRAVADPATVIEDFTQEELTPEAVSAMKAVHPEALKEAQGMGQETIAAAKANGKTVPRETARQLAILLQDHRLLPRLYDQKTTDRLQALFASNAQGEGPKRSPGRPVKGLSEARMTNLEKALSGA